MKIRIEPQQYLYTNKIYKCALSKRKIFSLDEDDDESQGETQNSRLSKSKKVMLIDNYCNNDKDQLSGNAHTIIC